MAHLDTRPSPLWLNRAKQLARKRWSEQHNYYRNAVYLTDPAADKQIEDIIRKDVWPTALVAIATRRFRIFGADEPRIENEWQVNACSSVVIVVEDPERPLVPGTYPPWYARLHVECQVTGIGLTRDYLSVHLPLSTPFNLIVDVLSETSHGGLPTSMSVDDDPAGEPSLNLVFEHGGSGSSSSAATPKERITRKLLAYCDFAESVYELERSPNDSLLFRKLIREVNSVFEI